MVLTALVKHLLTGSLLRVHCSRNESAGGREISAGQQGFGGQYGIAFAILGVAVVTAAAAVMVVVVVAIVAAAVEGK
jgi:hypothetical protein